MRITEITPEYRKIVDDFIKEEWAGPVIVSKGHTWDTSVLPGFIAIDDDNALCGMVTYRFEGDECEITTLDNTHAIRFYQRFGFTLREVHINALEKSRKLKPSIPLVGIDNIPLQHEFEFEIIF